MELNNKTFRKLLLLAAIIMLLCWGLYHPEKILELLGSISSVLTPFLIGGALAFILNVPMSFFERHLFRKNARLQKLRKPISLVLSFLFCFAIIVFVCVAVIPELVKTVTILIESVPQFMTELASDITAWGKKIFDETPQLANWLSTLRFDWQSLVTNIMSWVQAGASGVVGSTITFATALFGGVFNAFVGIIFSIYILMSKETLSRQGKMLLYSWLKPARAEKTVRVLYMSKNAFAHFITGQCLEACIIGVMFAVAMWIFRFPYVMLISVLVGFTALIPIFGAFIGCFIGAFLILVQDPTKALWFVVMFLVIQQAEGNLVYPRVVGKSVGLPSVWVLVAATLGGSLMGLAGMLVMIPISAVAYALLRENSYERLKAKNLSVAEISKPYEDTESPTTQKKGKWH
ncbi:MAG: AI-2E family transporter [Oscillospiraceae bacterium]